MVTIINREWSQKMDKRIKILFALLFFFSSWSLVWAIDNTTKAINHSSDLFMNESKLLKIAPLPDNLSPEAKAVFLKENFVKDLNEIILHFKKQRQQNLNKLIHLFQIKDASILFEYGGGLSKYYKIIIISEVYCYWCKWTPETESFGKFRLNQHQYNTLLKKIDQLKSYKGEVVNAVIGDRTICFLSIYENNKRITCFASDIPNFPRKDYSKEYGILQDLQRYLICLFKQSSVT